LSGSSSFLKLLDPEGESIGVFLNVRSSLPPIMMSHPRRLVAQYLCFENFKCCISWCSLSYRKWTRTTV